MIVNYDLERAWKEAVMAYFRLLPPILENLWTPTKTSLSL